MLNVYPPYWGTGIRVAKIAADYRELIVQMKLCWYNRNYVRTHFGGSLYAMTDPFLMLMLMQVLGREYIVWDQTARIDFIKPGKGTVRVKFLITDDDVTAIKARTAHGEKYLPEFTVAVCDDTGETICRVTKTLYIRQKQRNK